MYFIDSSNSDMNWLINLPGIWRGKLTYSKLRNWSKSTFKNITHISYISFSKFNRFAASAARTLKPANIDLADQKPLRCVYYIGQYPYFPTPPSSFITPPTPEGRSVPQAKPHEARPCNTNYYWHLFRILIIGFDKVFLFLLSFYALYQLDLEIHYVVI